MSEAAVDNFLRQGMQHVYPDQWKEEFGAALSVTFEGVGIFLSNIPDERDVSFAAGVLTGLEFSADLAREVAHVNQSTKIGGMYLSPGDTDWQLIYTCKLMKGWLDPNSSASAQMVVDILSNIPGLVNIRAQYLKERFSSSERWPLDDGWSLLLLSHM